MPNLILPKINYQLKENDSVIFLAGPIRGSAHWQDRAVEIIYGFNEDVYTVSPSNRIREDYQQRAVPSNGQPFERQSLWERHYLRQALIKRHQKRGAIMFYLANQIHEMPINYKTCYNAPHARDTRGELGGWGWGLIEHVPDAPIIVGAEEKFDGLDIVKVNFLDVKPDMKFYTSLEDTCRAAVNLVSGR